MTELKAVPSGYDSAALSSMLGYLANARKSHDNNPFMRTILDSQARDNKAEYLADADLTVRAQAEDNDYTKQYNLAKMAQEAYDARAGRGVDMSRISGGALTPGIVSEDLNLGSQSDDSIAKVQQSMIDAQLLKPDAARANIRNDNANTYKAQVDAAGGRADVGDYTDIEDLDNMPQSLNINPDDTAKIRAAAAQQQNAATITQTDAKGGKYNQPYVRYTDTDGTVKTRPILEKDIIKEQKAGNETFTVAESTNSQRATRGKDDTVEKPKSVTRPANDLARVQAMLAQSGGMIDGIKSDGLRINPNTKEAEALLNGVWTALEERD